MRYWLSALNILRFGFVTLRFVTLYIELKSKHLYHVLSSLIHFADTTRTGTYATNWSGLHVFFERILYCFTCLICTDVHYCL
jgi:hypothetical protein